MTQEQLQLLVDLLKSSPEIAVATVLCVVLWKLYPEVKLFVKHRSILAQHREQRKQRESRERAAREGKYDAFITSIEPVVRGFANVIENNTEVTKRVVSSLDKLEQTQQNQTEKLTEVFTIVANMLDKNPDPLPETSTAKSVATTKKRK